MEAALKLFVEQGYQKTSIAGLETEAGLVPRAGAFYRHFDSKQTLLLDADRTWAKLKPACSAMLDLCLKNYSDAKGIMH